MNVPEWEHADKYLFLHFVGETVDQYYRQELGEAVEGFFLSIWNEVISEKYLIFFKVTMHNFFLKKK